MRLGVAIPFVAAVCITAADAENPNRPAAKPPAPTPQVRADRPANPKKEEKREARREAKQEGKRENNPGSAEYLAKLLKLDSDQRTKALASLPPARRKIIEKKIDEYQKMPEVERARNLDRLRRMQSLPPQRQAQVRQSLQKRQGLPPQRLQVVQRQINQMRSLSDVDRDAVMNSEEFRSKFTPAEQQIIADICLVTPRN